MNEIQLAHAIFHGVSPNELGFDQRDDGQGYPTMEDPTKLRFGAWKLDRGKFYVGILGMDVLTRVDGGRIHREEVGFLKLAVDEMTDGDGDPVPMIEIFLCPKVGQSQDADMQRVMTISRKGVRFNVPVLGAALPSGVPSRFRSDDGRYVYNVQGDPTPEYPFGRIVQYDTHGSPHEATWTPVAILKPTAL